MVSLTNYKSAISIKPLMGNELMNILEIIDVKSRFCGVVESLNV
jgi:hypothetical protein